MSTTLPVHCGKPDCGADIRAYDHVCSSQHLQYKINKTPTIVLLVSTLVAIHLFHLSGHLWPVYFLASMGLLHAFAIAFSRGRALGLSAVFSATVVVGWLLWVLLDWTKFQQFGIYAPLNALRQWIQAHPVQVVLSVLVLSTFWMFALGNSTALHGLHKTARLHLSVGAFILCTWGAWGLLIQLGDIPNWLVQATLIVTIFAPLAVIIAHSGIFTSLDSKLLALAFWMTLFSGYIAVTKPLVTMVRYSLGELLPRLVGRPSLAAFSDLWILEFTELLAQISLGLQIAAVFSLVAASITTAVEGFRGRVPSWFVAWKDRRSSSAVTGITAILLAPAEWAMVLATFVINLALFIIEVLKCIALNIITMLKEIPRFVLRIFQFLVVPVATFGAIGFGFLIVLQDFKTYVHHFTSDVAGNLSNADMLFPIVREATTLWGEAVTVVLLALLISSLTFSFGNRQFWDEGQAAICVFVLGYLATTAIGGALWFMLQYMPNRVELPFHFEGYGDLLKVNLLLVALLVATLVLGSVFAALLGNQRSSSGSSAAVNLTVFIAVLPLLAFCGYALTLGLGPLLSTAWSALGR